MATTADPQKTYTNRQHEGCTDCRSQSQVILGSIYAPEKQMSIGVCETCRARREGKS